MKKIIFIFLFIPFLSGCGDNITYTDVVNNPANLIADFKSYQSSASIKNQIAIDGYKWDVKEDSKLPPNDNRPPFNMLIVTVANYNYLGISGELVLCFFNDRLMNTCFYPDNISKFVEELKNQLGIDIVNQSEVTQTKYTKIWKHEDFQGRIYIGWHDIRLINENNRWICRYS